METVCSNSTFFMICISVELPRILFISPPATIFPGEPVELLCKTSSGPSGGGSSLQTIEWLDSRNKVLSNGGSLKFEQTDGSISGTYTCRVSNIAGITQKSTSIHVLNPPEWVTVELKENSQLVNDTNVCFICKSGVSTPPVRLEWTAARFGHNSLGVENSTSLIQTYDSSPDSDGHIVQKQICFHLYESLHNQMYIQCNVFYLGKKVKTEEMRLDVQYPPYLKSTPPFELRIPRNHLITIVCPIEAGKPYGFVDWEGVPLKDTQFEVATTKFSASTSVNCCRKNEHGRICFYYEVLIVEPTEILALWPSSYYPDQGETITYNCKVIHDKKLFLQLLQDN